MFYLELRPVLHVLFVPVLQNATKCFSSGRLWNLGVRWSAKAKSEGEWEGPTSSTTSIPPRNHLYLLNWVWCHRSSSFITSAAPIFFPFSLSTIHACGTLSSAVRPAPLTPATVTSEINFCGFANSTSSISMGDTCDPDTLRVSCNDVSELGFAANHGIYKP